MVEDLLKRRGVSIPSIRIEQYDVITRNDVNKTDELGWTPLMHAVRKGQFAIAKDLISYGANVSLQNYHGVTAFSLAAMGCDESLLSELYYHLSSPDLQQTESDTALQVASLHGLYPVVRWILTNTKAEVNTVSPITGVAPLHLAVIRKHYDVAELLIKFGADTTLPDMLGQDVFELAASTGSIRFLRLFDNDISTSRETSFDFSNSGSSQNYDNIDSKYTTNNIYLDLNEDVVLKNSPLRPVFKTCEDDTAFDLNREQQIKSLMSPSLHSVFSPSPDFNGSAFNWSLNSKNLKPDYNLHGLISPRIQQQNCPIEPPNRGQKRKILNNSGCSSWLKGLTKRRSRSVNDDLRDDCENSFNFDILKPNPIDFSNLLFNLGLEDFFPIFREQELDIWSFLTLTKEDLDSMGINDCKSQELILKRINLLKKTQL